MKSNKRVVKGWAVFDISQRTIQLGSLNGARYRLAIFDKQKTAKEMVKVAPNSWYIVPCTIHYSFDKVK